MVHNPIPPRSREVRTGELGNELTMRIVAQLTETVDTQMLRRLISGDQLAVSPDGLHSAHIVTFRLGYELAIHSELGVLLPRFERLQSEVGTRILRVEANSILVWGKVDGYPVGLWRLAERERTFLGQIDQLQRGPSGLVRGILNARRDEHQLITPWGTLFPVSDRAIVTPGRESLCLVEEFGGVPYAYQLLQDGRIDPYQMLTLAPAERAVGIVNWQGRLMLAVTRGTQSWLVELNRKNAGETPIRIQVDGDLHGMWPSPRGKALLLLIHPRGEPDNVRRLQLDDGTDIYEGRFHMDPSSIVWSPSESAVAVRIREGEGFDHVIRERIVGTGFDHLIARGLHLREFLIGDRGYIAAAIKHDGVYDLPVIGGRAGTQVPLAWNLHRTPQGGVRWTTVHGDRVLTWTTQVPGPRIETYTMR